MPIFRVFHLMPAGDRRSDDPLWDAYIAASIGGRVEAAVMAGLYREAAQVECDELARVFPLTNHIEHDWTTNDAVILHADRCRSTSVGDVVLDEAGALHACATMGWRQLDPEHRDAFLAKLAGDIPVLEAGRGAELTP